MVPTTEALVPPERFHLADGAGRRMADRRDGQILAVAGPLALHRVRPGRARWLYGITLRRTHTERSAMNTVYRIVVGVDGSDAGQRALDWAAEECPHRNGVVQAVIAWHPEHLLDNVVISTENANPQRFAHEIIAEAVAAARTAHPGLLITGVVERGRPAAVLVGRAQDAQLLVLGSHGHGRLFHATLGSTADAVVRTAPCPVVIVPAVREAVHRPASNDRTAGIPTGIL